MSLKKEFKRMLSLASLLPYSRLVIFWGSTLISTFSVLTAVFMEKACFGVKGDALK